MDFTRTADNALNAGLNYGYSILLACFNREIVANGYITQLGNKPPKGIVQVLSVTEKQFSRTEYLVGKHQTDIIDSDERLIVL